VSVAVASPLLVGQVAGCKLLVANSNALIWIGIVYGFAATFPHKSTI
jgi:hypothetical protein